MELKELENTVVNTKTQAEYDELMRIYEKAGWKWRGTGKPTGCILWREYKENTCIRIEDKFTYGQKVTYQEYNYKVINKNKKYDKNSKRNCERHLLLSN